MRGMKSIRLPLLALFALLLAACGSMPGKKVDTVAAYGTAIRWSEWETAWAFVDPAAGGGGPIPAGELARIKQVKVSGYEVRVREPQPDGVTLRQVVEIRYIDEHTQRELSVRDEQRWRTDDEGVHWLLTSGLPQF
jgi:uncharacterized lipoprotein